MKTFLFGGSLKSVVDQVCEKFDVKLKINSVENVGSDFDLEELIKYNFNFDPEYNQKAQELLIDFYKDNFDTFCRMFVRRGPLLSDYHELTNHFTIYFYSLFEILTNKKIELVIFNNFPHQGIDFILYKIAKILKIKTILLTQTIFPNKFVIISDMKDFGIYENITNEYNKNQIEKILLEKDLYKNFTLKIREDIKKKGLSLTSHDSLSKYSPYYNEKKKLRTNLLSFRFIKKILLKLFIYLRLIKRKDLEKIYLENLNKVELKDFQVEKVLNNKNKKIFFAFHSQPEMSTSLFAGDFDDQLRILEKINRKKITDKFILLTREHPAQNHYQRDDLFFRRLKFLKNLNFLNREFSMDRILESVDVIVTSSGTVGWEGLLSGKKCLLFGQSWYSKLHGVLEVANDTSDEEIIEFLNKDFDKDKFYISLQNLYSSFYDGIISKWHISISPNFDQKENAKIVVENILKFLKKK